MWWAKLKEVIDKYCYLIYLFIFKKTSFITSKIDKKIRLREEDGYALGIEHIKWFEYILYGEVSLKKKYMCI